MSKQTYPTPGDKSLNFYHIQFVIREIEVALASKIYWLKFMTPLAIVNSVVPEFDVEKVLGVKLIPPLNYLHEAEESSKAQISSKSTAKCT